MHAYDLIMILVLAAGVLLGMWKGLAWQVASLASIFASYFIAMRFRTPLAAQIDAESPWNMFLAMLILYLGSALVIWLAFRLVSNAIEKVKLKEFDRHAGAVLGGARGVIWCVIVTLFAVTLLGEEQQQQIIGSRSGYYIALLLDKAHAIMPDEVHQVVGPYIHKLDESLPDGPTSHDEHMMGGTSHDGHEHDHGAFGGNILPSNIPGSASDDDQQAMPDWRQFVPAIRNDGGQ